MQTVQAYARLPQQAQNTGSAIPLPEHLDIPRQSSIIMLLYCGVWIPPQLPFGARFCKKEEGEYENRQL
jgi:hypothetical protein